MPGSLIVDTDQASTTLYIHVIGVSDRAAAHQAYAVIRLARTLV